MAVTLGLAGDTMLGRGVAKTLASGVAPQELLAPDVVAAAGEADLFVLNLECCISERGSPWPDPRKPFFFRAPPVAVEALAHLGVDCVTLANNHALDFGEEALLDTFRHLRAGAIEWVGAGPDEERARAPVVLEAEGFRLAVLGVSDHPDAFAARSARPGIAFADLWEAPVPAWLLESVRRLAAEADAVLVTPHWGPNMVPTAVPHVREAAEQLVAAGATLVAGHSAHVFQGVAGPGGQGVGRWESLAGPGAGSGGQGVGGGSQGVGRWESVVLFDLGDFLDDYAVDPALRNDLGLLWLVTLDGRGPIQLEALPLKLDFCYTRLADGDDAEWIRRRFRRACAEFGTEVEEQEQRLVVRFRANGGREAAA